MRNIDHQDAINELEEAYTLLEGIYDFMYKTFNGAHPLLDEVRYWLERNDPVANPEELL